VHKGKSEVNLRKIEAFTSKAQSTQREADENRTARSGCATKAERREKKERSFAALRMKMLF
jgi:hypothetical protein